MTAAAAIVEPELDPLDWDFGRPSVAWEPAEWTRPRDGEVIDYSVSRRVVDFINAVVANSADSPGAQLDPFQAWSVGEALSRVPVVGDDGVQLVDADGAPRWQPRFRAYAMLCPRQQGKSLVGAGLQAASLFLGRDTGQTVSVAHSLVAADIIARRTREIIAGNEALASRTKRSTQTRGITTKTGARSICLAGTSKALNGFTVSGLVGIIDEGHVLPTGVLSQLMIGCSTTDATLVILSTAGDESSDMLRDFIADCRRGVPGFGMAYWHTRENLTRDDDDWRDEITRATPGIACGRLDRQRILDECERLPAQDFKRYRCNLFVTAQDGVEGIFPGNTWRDLPRLAEGERPPAQFTAALDVANDRSAASLAVSWRREDGTVASSIVASLVQPTTSDLAELVMDFTSNTGGNLWRLGIDFLRLGDLADQLDVLPVHNRKTIHRVGLKDQVVAAALIRKRVLEGSLAIDNNPALDIIASSVVMKTVHKTLGTDATPFRIVKRSSQGPAIDPLIAISLSGMLLDSVPENAAIVQIF